jgi:hypothetical protein
MVYHERMSKVVDHPCGECQFSANSPFSEEIIKALKADLEKGIPHSCHWVEKSHPVPANAAMGCFALSGNGVPSGPYCSNGVAMLLKLAEKPDASDVLKQEAAKYRDSKRVAVYGPEDVRERLPEMTNLVMTIESPYGTGTNQIVVSK